MMLPSWMECHDEHEKQRKEAAVSFERQKSKLAEDVIKQLEEYNLAL